MRERQTTVTVALPAAGSTALTSALRVPLGPHRGAFEIHLELPDLPALADAKTATVTLVEADTEGGSYSAVPTVGNMILTGASGAGATGKLWRFYLPPVHKEWIKGSVAIQSSGGDNTAKSLTLAIDI